MTYEELRERIAEERGWTYGEIDGMPLDVLYSAAGGGRMFSAEAHRAADRGVDAPRFRVRSSADLTRVLKSLGISLVAKQGA